MTYSIEERALIVLSSIEGVGPRRISRLLAAVQRPQEVFALDPGTLREILGPALCARFLQCACDGDHEALFKRLDALDVRAVTRYSPHYPAALEDIFDPPYVLYVRGTLPLAQEKAVGVVGSRTATRYGQSAARSLSAQLARQDVCVVSGMARGIDSAAHLGALDAGGKTIAVMGCGLDICYPPENRGLFDRIAGQGALVSEYLPGAQPLPIHFRQRNRIIAGLSQACLMVEGARRSGAMITVDFAADAGREIFAVPGPIDSPMSESPNQLIRDGAHLAASAMDIVETMGWGVRTAEKPRGNTSSVQLDAQEAAVVAPLLREDLTFDELEQITKMQPQALNSLLTMLSLRGIIKQHPGGVYSTQ